VFIRTPAQPSSIAIAASLAVPTPASTITGTFARSRISWMFHGLRMPMPEPISDASGINGHAADRLQHLRLDRSSLQ